MGDFGGPEPQIVRFWGSPPQNGVVWGGGLLPSPSPSCGVLGFQFKFGGVFGVPHLQDRRVLGSHFPPGVRDFGGGVVSYPKS